MSKTTKTIAEKRVELAELLAWFESDEFAIEQATDKFKVAEALAADIEVELMERKNTITVLKQKFDKDSEA